MASLTHVCMWDDKGWRRISAEEAARLHPTGTVSARSGLFMCELCGQYVLLTDGQYQIRHFRHSSAEKDKDCIERTLAPGSSISYVASEHETPLRILGLKNKDFSFEIGFVKIPDELWEPDLEIQIKGEDYGSTKYAYRAERLLSDRTSYLSVGSKPCSAYIVEINNSSDIKRLNHYWPKRFTGIDPQGTVFSSDLCKKLPSAADVVVGKHYYILKLGKMSKSSNKHVEISLVCSKTFSFNTWYVYDVVAKDYSKEAAMFFLDFHCLLTENPVSMIPVWPECIMEPYIIKHDSNTMTLYVNGINADVRAFPQATIRSYDNSVIEVSIRNRQQLVSVGRTKALQYSYYWKVPLDKTNNLPKAFITDISGNELLQGLNKIPKQKMIVIKLPFDGSVYRKVDGIIIDKIPLSAGQAVDLTDISENTEVLVYVGLDLIWNAQFGKRARPENCDEKELLMLLNKAQGASISLPGNLGAIYSKLYDYPEIRKWIKKCVLKNEIKDTAYQELASFAKRKINEMR